MLLLARTTPLDQVKRRSDGLSVFLVDLRDAPPEQLQRPADRDDDQPRRRTASSSTSLEVPAENLIGEEGRASATSSTA